MKLLVKNSGTVNLQSFDDFPDGHLFIGEAQKHLPITIKRFYFINNLFNHKAVRGKHAHRKSEQYIFCINGSFVLDLDDGENKQSLTLKDPACGIRLGAMLWHTMRKFSKDCLILVVSNTSYNPKDYIRDYDKFLSLAKS